MRRHQDLRVESAAFFYTGGPFALSFGDGWRYKRSRARIKALYCLGAVSAAGGVGRQLDKALTRLQRPLYRRTWSDFLSGKDSSVVSGFLWATYCSGGTGFRRRDNDCHASPLP